MKRTTLILIVIALCAFGTHLLFVRAECTINGTPGNEGTPGNDTIVCDSTPTTPKEAVGAQGGDDTIVIDVGSTVVYVGGDARAHEDTLVAGDSSISGPSGSDNIVVNGNVLGMVMGDYNQDLGGANDTITVGSTGHASGVSGDSYGAVAIVATPEVGDDTIVIDTGAVIDYDVSGDDYGLMHDNAVGGNDTIIINGTVAHDVNGQVGNDNITIGGTVGRTVDGGLGNDTITLNEGANGGSDGELIVTGNDGTDKLVFGFIINSEEDYNALATLIASNAPNGSITINGQIITWSNFEELVNALIANFGLGSKLTFKDNRLNQTDAGASALVYCSADGFHVLRVDSVTAYGSQAFTVDTAQVEAALAKAVDQSETVEVKSGAGITLLVSPDGKLTVIAPDISDASKTYQFTFETTVCN